MLSFHRKAYQRNVRLFGSSARRFIVEKAKEEKPAIEEGKAEEARKSTLFGKLIKGTLILAVPAVGLVVGYQTNPKIKEVLDDQKWLKIALIKQDFDKLKQNASNFKENAVNSIVAKENKLVDKIKEKMPSFKSQKREKEVETVEVKKEVEKSAHSKEKIASEMLVSEKIEEFGEKIEKAGASLEKTGEIIEKVGQIVETEGKIIAGKKFANESLRDKKLESEDKKMIKKLTQKLTQKPKEDEKKEKKKEKKEKKSAEKKKEAQPEKITQPDVSKKEAMEQTKVESREAEEEKLVKLALEILKKKEEEFSKNGMQGDTHEFDYLMKLQEQRRKFEAVLVHELESQEAELRQKISKEYQDKLSELLSEQGKAYEQAVATQLKAQEEGLMEKMREKFEDEKLELKRLASVEAKKRSKTLQDLRMQVEAVREAWESTNDIERASLRIHQITSSTFGLIDKLSSSSPAPDEISALRELVVGDRFASAIAQSLPLKAHTDGIPTRSELKARFPRMRKECVRASLVPEGDKAGLVGQIVGAALASVTFTRKGMVEGKSAEDVLARAEFLLEMGDLISALEEIRSLKGLAALTAKDWVGDAEARLASEMALKALSSHVALMNLAIVKESGDGCST